jgi:hypothetical protein
MLLLPFDTTTLKPSAFQKSSIVSRNVHGELFKHNTGVEETKKEATEFRTTGLANPQRSYGEHYTDGNT